MVRLQTPVIAFSLGWLMFAFSTASPAAETPAERGYRLLTNKAYLSPDFDQPTFDEVWRVWPEPLRAQAQAATIEQRREMAFARYGLTRRPGDDSGKPQQYVVDEHGNWTMNCFACHAGQVAGKSYPGSPNSTFALQTLTEEIRATKVRLKKPLTRMDYGSFFIPLGQTNGTTNSVIFGVVLLAIRDAELNLKRPKSLPSMAHHDMDAPPWWNFKKRTHLYIDGFAPKGHRPLMQFMLVKENGPEKFRQWERDFRDVYAYLESLQPPAYPHKVDRDLAAAGATVFAENCAQCHGTYGKGGRYPEKNIPLDEIGTDPARHESLSPLRRAHYARSWFARPHEKAVITEPAGYVAPPLDGIWASAPYLHNGSVPTLWHVLNPAERPTLWRRRPNDYDQEHVGLAIETFDELPPAAKDAKVRREYFDTRSYGKSAAGHLFPDQLDAKQKRAVLEYLKTL